jgi:EmrB/QacA subfamily drug resistance transporter
MASIDATIVAVAIPQLTTALGAPLAWVAWTLTAYQLVQVVMLPLAGKLSDSLGRKKVFLFCVGTFTFGSLLCGLAPSIWFLIAARAIQAIGGGGLMPSAVGLVSDQYRERRAQAIGLFASVFPVGGILGPNLGGFILQHWTWREMFFVNLPIGVIALVGVAVLLPADAFRKARHIDLPGIVLYAGGIVLLLASMTAAADDPDLWRSPLLWGAVAASITLFVAFLRYIRVATDPIMDYQLVVRQPFLNTNLYNLVYGAAVFGFTSFIPRMRSRALA